MKIIKEMISKFKKTYLIFLVIFIVGAIFVVPPFVYGGFVRKVQNLDYSGYFNMVQLGFNNSFKRLSDVTKIKTPFNGLSYTFNVYRNYVLIFICSTIYILYLASKNKKGEFEDIEYGSSDWAKSSEIYKKFSEKSGILLAENIALPMSEEIPGNKNVLVIGNTGSGKSSAFVFPNIKQELGSYVFTDPKGEIYDYSAGYFKKLGYDIKVLNLKNPNKSDGYNPLHHIKTDVDIDIITHTIVMGQGEQQTSDPYWTDNAQELLKSLIRFLKETRSEEEQNIASCGNLVRMANSGKGGNILDDLMSILPEEHLARKNYETVKLASDKAFASICSTLQSILGKFDSPEIASLTSTNTFEFENIGKKKTVVYVISPDTHSTFDFLLTIFFSQMIQELYDYADENGGKLDIPVCFFLDEFANIGRIPDFEKKVATARSRRISFNIIIQSLEQLEDIYGTKYETIVGNCGTHLFLGSNSGKTLEFFSKRLGEKTIKIKSEDKEETKHEQKMGRYLMTPDEIGLMPYEECLIYSSGVRTIKGKKYFYYKHKNSMIPDELRENHNEYEAKRGKWKLFSLNEENEENEKDKVENFFAGALENIAVEKELFDNTDNKPLQKNETKDKKEVEKLLFQLFEKNIENVDSKPVETVIDSKKIEIEKQNKNKKLDKEDRNEIAKNISKNGNLKTNNGEKKNSEINDELLGIKKNAQNNMRKKKNKKNDFLEGTSEEDEKALERPEDEKYKNLSSNSESSNSEIELIKMKLQEKVDPDFDVEEELEKKFDKIFGREERDR